MFHGTAEETVWTNVTFVQLFESENQDRSVNGRIEGVRLVDHDDISSTCPYEIIVFFYFYQLVGIIDQNC